jgi:hypothetical protein
MWVAPSGVPGAALKGRVFTRRRHMLLVIAREAGLPRDLLFISLASEAI